MGQRGHHHLLAHHPVQVAAGQIVALADEAQRLWTVELLPAGGKIGTRKRFVHRFFEAYIDTAQGVGDQREAQQPDLGVVVDSDTGEVGDRLDQRLTAGLGALPLGLVGRRAGFDQADPLLFLGLAIDAVDLGLAQPGRGNVGVAWDRDRGRRLPVVRDAHQDDGVGVGGGFVACPQGRQFLGAQRVAVGIGATVHTDQQDVDRPVVATLTQRRREDVEDAVLKRADFAPRHPGHEDDRHGRHSRNHTGHALLRHHTRLLSPQQYRR